MSVKEFSDDNQRLTGTWMGNYSEFSIILVFVVFHVFVFHKETKHTAPFAIEAVKKSRRPIPFEQATSASWMSGQED